jgi:ribosomal protein L11 methyltransferase
MAWLEVSLRVNQEAAEAVAEVLARYAASGVAFDLDLEGRADAPVTVKAYLAVDDETETRRRKVEEGLAHLSHIWPVIPAPTFIPIADQDWTKAWKEQIQVLHLGRRVVIKPSWRTYQPQGDEIVLEMDPGMAFGTGLHPTTQLCIEALETLVRPGMTVLDLGTGTGILAMVAARLGARHVLALDIDSDAVRAAAKNVRSNALDDRIAIRQGSLSDAVETYDLVVANILAPVIITMAASGLGSRLSSGGTLVTSGILAEQIAEVTAALETHGLRVTEALTREEWAALVARRPAAG